MMKLLLLLLLLTSWSHLGSEARNCDTSISMPSLILNLEGSHKAKADVSFTHGYCSDNLTSCLEDCCSAAHGPCSVATYKNQSVEKNCLHFYCWPLLKCKFLPTTFGDTFTFPGARRWDGHDIEGSDNVIPSITDGQPKSHARSITARKGAENVAVSRKGIFAESTFQEADTSPENVVTNQELDTELTLVDILNEDESFNNHSFKSKIKARKGVESLTESVLAPTPTVIQKDSPSSINELIYSSNASDSNSNTSELVSLIERVFEEELNDDHSKMEVPYNLTFPSHVDNISSTTIVSPHTLLVSSTMITHGLDTSFNVESFSEIHSSSIFHPSIPTSTFSTAVIKTEYTPISAQLSEPLTISSRKSSQRTNKLWPSSEYFATSTPPIILTTSSLYLTSDEQEIHTSIITTSTTRNPISDRLKLVETETENERRYKSSMHLVMSLVIGLLVLLTVMGVVAKRVYDLWLRRHYSRMDFLIDGLYDGYS